MLTKCCAECGYLGIRSSTTKELVEVEETFRREGAEDRTGGVQAAYVGKPVCAIMAADLQAVVSSRRGSSIAQMLSEQRNCEHGTRWLRGFTPKEHLQMNLIEEQREKHRKWEEEDRAWRQAQAERNEACLERQARIDQEWRESQARTEHEWRLSQTEQQHAWHAEDVAAAQANTRSNWGAGWLGVAGAVVGVALGFFLANLSAMLAVPKS
jgi:hypothetical protein